MPTPRQTEAIEEFKETGSVAETASRLGVSERNAHALLRSGGLNPEARRSIIAARDPGIAKGMARLGMTTPPVDGWMMSEPDEEGNRFSFRFKMGDGPSLIDIMRQVQNELETYTPRVYEPRPPPSGRNLAVLDISDTHINKLASVEETGTAYSTDIAVHRMVEGGKSLIRKCEVFGVGRILLVLGNDILNTDTVRSTTTAGTYQESDKTQFQAYRAAKGGLVSLIETLTEVAPVDLLFVPSNHDWFTGWSLAQDVASWFRLHPNVRATDYNMSERHRKYYRFGGDLMGFTHGDGAKEQDLYALMMKEARLHISDSHRLYWFLGHYHHKIRKRIGQTSRAQEKDLTGMTIIGAGGPTEGHEITVEYVRSPSAPDGWHHRNGYVNAQAAECFMHDPDLGQDTRFTLWF